VHRRILIALSCSAAALFPVAAHADTAGVWTTAGRMNASRVAPVAFSLPDGGALVPAGSTGPARAMPSATTL